MYNSTCSFSCETGFVRIGSETLECTALGQWTGSPPLCEGTVQLHTAGLAWEAASAHMVGSTGALECLNLQN